MKNAQIRVNLFVECASVINQGKSDSIYCKCIPCTYQLFFPFQLILKAMAHSVSVIQLRTLQIQIARKYAL